MSQPSSTSAFRPSTAAAESLKSAPPPTLSGAAVGGNLSATQKKSWDSDWEKKDQEEKMAKKKEWEEKRASKKKSGKKGLRMTESDLADLNSTAAEGDGYLDYDAGAEDGQDDQQEQRQLMAGEDNADGGEMVPELVETEGHPDGASMLDLAATESALTDEQILAATQERADMESRNAALEMLGLGATEESLANTESDLAVNATESDLAPSLAATESEPLPDVAPTGSHYGKHNFDDHWHKPEVGDDRHKLVFAFGHCMHDQLPDIRRAVADGKIGPDGGITLWAKNNDLTLFHASGQSAVNAWINNEEVAIYEIFVKAGTQRFMMPVVLSLPTVPSGRNQYHCPGLPGYPEMVLFPNSKPSQWKLVDVNPNLDALIQTRGVNTNGQEVFYPTAQSILSQVTQSKKNGADGIELTVFSLAAPKSSPGSVPSSAEEGEQDTEGQHWEPLARAYSLIRAFGFDSEKHLRYAKEIRDEKDYMTIHTNADGSRRFSVQTAAVNHAQKAYANFILERCPKPARYSDEVAHGDRTTMRLQDLVVEFKTLENSTIHHKGKLHHKHLNYGPQEYLDWTRDVEERVARHYQRFTRPSETSKDKRVPLYAQHGTVYGLVVLRFRLLKDIAKHLEEQAERAVL
jgi:hypothetical protein